MRNAARRAMMAPAAAAPIPMPAASLEERLLLLLLLFANCRDAVDWPDEVGKVYVDAVLPLGIAWVIGTLVMKVVVPIVDLGGPPSFGSGDVNVDVTVVKVSARLGDTSVADAVDPASV
jgi:hypothetical protein